MKRSLLEEIRADADRAVRADLALRALADAEDMEVSDEELEPSVARWPSAGGTTGEADLGAASSTAPAGLPAVRSEQRKAKALTWLLDHVELVDEDGNPVSP